MRLFAPDWTQLIDPTLLEVVGSDHPIAKQIVSGAKAALAEAEAMVKRGDVAGALCRLGRNPAVQFFDHWRATGLISDEQLRAHLLEVWSMAEFPCRYLPRGTWLEWFRVAGFLSDGEPAPTEPVEVWRAQVGRTWGLSWTRDVKQAFWFSQRNSERFALKDVRVLRGFAPPAAVLAIVAGPESRGENEVIVNPVLMRRLGKVSKYG